MLNEADFKTFLNKSPFAESPLLALDVPHEAAGALALQVKPEQELAAWKYLREQVSTTGRWPLAVGFWGPQEADVEKRLKSEDFFSRWAFEHENDAGDARTAQDIVNRAEALDISTALAAREPEKSLEEVLAEPERPRPQELYVEHLDWFSLQDDTRLILLLPTEHGWAAPAYIHWYGAEMSGSALTVALLRHWQQDYGAELVAHYGTMLQLQVERKPQSYREALELAWQQDTLAPCTLALPGVELYEHAWALMELDRWFLHERP